jgi:hypothetical protein
VIEVTPLNPEVEEELIGEDFKELLFGPTNNPPSKEHVRNEKQVRTQSKYLQEYVRAVNGVDKEKKNATEYTKDDYEAQLEALINFTAGEESEPDPETV